MPLLLYADDLTLKPESAAGLQKQLEALASFCNLRQLTVNISKTKVVVLEGKQSSTQDFMMSGALVERMDSYNYLTFVFHAVQNMAFGAGSWLLGGGCWQGIVRHAVLGIKDPALQWPFSFADPALAANLMPASSRLYPIRILCCVVRHVGSLSLNISVLTSEHMCTQDKFFSRSLKRCTGPALCQAVHMLLSGLFWQYSSYAVVWFVMAINDMR